MLAENCLFCKIVENKAPSHKILENDYVLAFLDINPMSEGHTLVVPKFHCEKLHEVPDMFLTETIKAVQVISKALAPNYNILQNNGSLAHQLINHVHFHIMPKTNENDGLIMEMQPRTPQSVPLSEVSKTLRLKVDQFINQ